VATPAPASSLEIRAIENRTTSFDDEGPSECTSWNANRQTVRVHKNRPPRTVAGRPKQPQSRLAQSAQRSPNVTGTM
jgi:hypothetical protein